MRKETKILADKFLESQYVKGMKFTGNRREFYRWYNKWIKEVVDDCFRMAVIERIARG